MIGMQENNEPFLFPMRGSAAICCAFFISAPERVETRKALQTKERGIVMAVSLKKKPAIREYTPVHLMDEEEAVRIFCPRRKEHTGGKNEITAKETNRDNPSKMTVNSDSNLENVLEWARFIGCLISCITSLSSIFWLDDLIDFLTALI